jgi:predicted amidohydrolase
MTSVVVALIQVSVTDGEPPLERVERVTHLVREASRSADLVLLPELWHVGAFALGLARDQAQPLTGPLPTAMARLAASTGTWLHAGSFAELDEASGRRYNTSLLLDPEGNVAATYRKQYLFGWDAGERSVMSAGDDLMVTPTPLGPTGLATCYDLRFPELFRSLVDDGATAFVIASGWPAARIEHWSVLARARAIENQAWLVACNTAGEHNGVAMGGRSLVVDPLGQVVAEAGTAEQVLRVELDPAAATAWREKFPVLQDRRT